LKSRKKLTSAKKGRSGTIKSNSTNQLQSGLKKIQLLPCAAKKNSNTEKEKQKKKRGVTLDTKKHESAERSIAIAKRPLRGRVNKIKVYK